MLVKLMIEEEILKPEETLPDQLASDLDGHFEQVVLTYQDRLYAFAVRLAGNPQDAEEIAQDTFVRAYRALSGYEREQIRTLALRPWLYQITLNIFRNRTRRKQHAIIPLEQVSTDPLLEPSDDERERPEAMAETHERIALLTEQMARLPERYRVPVLLRHIEGLGYNELASILSQPVGTIKSNVHRGIDLLRKAMIPHLGERR